MKEDRWQPHNSHQVYLNRAAVFVHHPSSRHVLIQRLAVIAWSPLTWNRCRGHRFNFHALIYKSDHSLHQAQNKQGLWQMLLPSSDKLCLCALQTHVHDPKTKRPSFGEGRAAPPWKCSSQPGQPSVSSDFWAPAKTSCHGWQRAAQVMPISLQRCKLSPGRLSIQTRVNQWQIQDKSNRKPSVSAGVARGGRLQWILNDGLVIELITVSSQ